MRLGPGKPWVHGSIGEFCGEVCVFTSSGGHRLTDIYPDREWLCSLPRLTSGVIGAVPGVIGAMQASEALKVIARYGETLDGRLFTIDLLTLQTEIIEL